MRKIRNTNSHIEFLECKDNGDIINSKGFQLGEICYQLTPQKVTFYLETADNPFSTMVWSIDLPFEFNDVTVSTTEEAADALQGIMVLDDLSKIREDLDNEILRSTNKDTEHDVLISGLTDDLEDEIARATSAETALDDKIDAEILRSTNKDTEHDALISGLTDALDVEIQNRIAGDAQLQNNIGIEADDRRHADVILMNLISGITDDLNDEIVRSTEKDAEHDAFLSGLTDDLDVEIQNRIAGDAQLQNVISIESEDRRHADVILKDLIDTVNADLNAEIQNIINDESGLSETLTNEIIRATNKDQEHDDLISGLTDDIAVLDEEKQDKLYAGKYITINGNNISADSNHVYRLTQQAYNNLPEIDVEGLYIITDAPDVDLDVYAPLSALTAEVERATSAETQILETLDDFAKKTDLQAEVDRAIAREDDIAEDLEDEFHRAQSAEHLLEDKITTERERAMDVEDELRELIISGGTGSGITSAQVQTMIENYTYDKEYIDDKQDKVSIWNGTGMNAVIVNNSGNTASQNYAFAEGVSNKATNTAAHAEGMGNVASGGFSHAEGRNTTASQIAAHTEGSGTQAKGTDSHAEGTYTIANNNSEHASGYYNVSRAGSTPDDKTLFSVGNGTSAERHNAFEIMQNGDIFISSGDTDIKLQDYLGGGSGGDITILSGDVISLSGDVQNVSGDIITLSGDVIALEGKIDTLSGNVYTKTETSSKTEISDALDLKQDVLTAGDGIQISGDVISVTGGGITSGDVQEMISGYAYSKSETSSKTEINDALALKQNTLTAGSGITISGDVISISGTSLNVPISGGTGIGSIRYNDLTNNTASGTQANAFGYNTHANGNCSITYGIGNTANGASSLVGGESSMADGYTSAAIGYHLETKNIGEAAFGRYNKSTKNTSSPAENTIMSVGVGYDGGSGGDVRMNALEVKYDGTIIIDKNPTGLTSEFVRLQDYLFDGDDYYKKSETSSKTEIDDALDLKLDASAFTESDYYKKSETSGKTELSTEFDKYYKKDETSSKTEIDSAFSAITKVIEDNEEVISGALNDLNDRKQDVLTAGDGIQISGDVISVTGGTQPVDAYTKAESDAKFATITNFNSHSGDTTVHITAQERTDWNAKPDVWCGDETAWSQISGSTENGVIYLVY